MVALIFYGYSHDPVIDRLLQVYRLSVRVEQGGAPYCYVYHAKLFFSCYQTTVRFAIMSDNEHF